ncbi:MAG: hypothetical protein E6H92_01065 [Chloroflexi bacterium]|nr:MAG: hypothetical protein E6H92_01065 [Chloroflexota bacterium]
MKKPALPRVGLPHLLLAVAAVLFLALTFKPAVSGDGVGYFSYLHSVIVDRDLDMSDEYAAARAAHVDVYPPQISTRTKTGMLANLFPVGPALMSAPAYVAALALRPSGAPQVDAPFTTAYTLASLLYGLLALAICYRFARAVTGSSGAALTGAVAAALTTPLLYYLVYQPSYAHTFSAFAVSAFMYLWWSTRGHRSTRAWLLLGLLGGMMALVRWQDGPLAAVALLDLPKERFRVLLLVPGIVLGFLPQLLVDHVIFGSWLPSRPGLDPLHGHYFDVLFSSWHGLFTWTPGVLLGDAALHRRRLSHLVGRILFRHALPGEPDAVLRHWLGRAGRQATAVGLKSRDRRAHRVEPAPDPRHDLRDQGRRQPGLGGAAQGPGGCPELCAAPAAGLRGAGPAPLAASKNGAEFSWRGRGPAPAGRHRHRGLACWRRRLRR